MLNRDLRVVRATLNQAKTFFDLENFTPPKIRFLKVEKTRRERLVSSAEIKSILFYLLKPQLKDESAKLFLLRRRSGLLFLLSAVTGARQGELVALKVSDILEDMQVLKITGKKTRFKTAKTVRYFPLVAVVKRILGEVAEIQTGEFIFSQKATLTETYLLRANQSRLRVLRHHLRSQKNGLIPYDLRHTATTLMMHNGAALKRSHQSTGQSRHTLWHYTHANENSINAAVSVLENFAENSIGDFLGLGLDTKEKRKLLKSASATK